MSGTKVDPILTGPRNRKSLLTARDETTKEEKVEESKVELEPTTQAPLNGDKLLSEVTGALQDLTPDQLGAVQNFIVSLKSGTCNPRKRSSTTISEMGPIYHQRYDTIIFYDYILTLC